MASAGTAYVDVEAKLDSFSSQIDDAVSALTPEVSIGADTSEVDAALGSLEADPVDVTVDASTAEAQSEIDSIEGGTVESTVEVDTSGAQESISGLGDELNGLASELGGAAGGGATGMIDGFAAALGGASAAGATATAGIGLLAFGVNDAVNSFGEAQVVQAETEAMLDSLGATAVTTADHIGYISQSIMEYSGFSDEAVQSGANTLLMFDNINNQGTFDRALEASADLARRLGTDVPQAARMLGIALQDPEAGMNRLRRAGVVLTDGQKETITAMMATGDVAGAQGVIFDALEGKIGNLAEAYGETLPGQIDRTNEAIDEHKEKIGEDIAPWYERALAGVGHMVSGLAGGTKGLQDSFTATEGSVRGVGTVFGELPPALQPAVGALDEVSGAADDAAGSVLHLDDRVQAYLDGTYRVPEAQRALRDSFEGLNTTLGSTSFTADDVAVNLQDIVTNAAALGVATGDMRGAVDSAVFGLLSLQNQGKLSADQVAGVRSQLESLPGNTEANVSTPGAIPARSQAQAVGDALLGIPDHTTAYVGVSVNRAGFDQLVRDLEASEARRFTMQVSVNNPPARASGGPVSSGESYLVGEQGPEMFVPRRSGSIIPAPQTSALVGGGGVHVGQITIHAPTGNGDDIARAVTDAIRKLERAGR